MKKGILLGAGASVCVILIGFLLFALNKPNGVEPQISYIEGSYSINVDDFRALAGDADYIFSAEITGIKGYIYKNPVAYYSNGYTYATYSGEVSAK